MSRKSLKEKPPNLAETGLLHSSQQGVYHTVSDFWKGPRGIATPAAINPSPQSRLYTHRQKSLAAFQRGFDDIDYAFPGQSCKRC